MDHAPQGVEGLFTDFLPKAEAPGECAKHAFVLLRNRIFAPTDDMLSWQLSRIILAWEAFPDRELANFPSAGGARKGTQCCVLLFPESGFRSLPMPEFHGQHASAMFPNFSALRTLIQTRCFDVTNGLDLEVKGFVKGGQGAFKCSLSLACEVCGHANSHTRQFFFLRNSK
jgi:hypothetical protein